VVHYNLTANQLVVTWDNVGRYNTQGCSDRQFPARVCAVMITWFANRRGPDRLLLPDDGVVGIHEHQYRCSGWFWRRGWQRVRSSKVRWLTDLHLVLQNKYIWFDANLDVVVDPGASA
jgi:hypothetical protein